MSLPGGFRAWALAQGCSPHHPDEWTPDDLVAFQAWKRAHYQAKWDAHHQAGMFDTLHPRIAEDIAQAHQGPPSRPWRTCPCHPYAPRGKGGSWGLPEAQVSPQEVRAWVASDALTRAKLSPKVAACLAYLARDFGGPR